MAQTTNYFYSYINFRNYCDDYEIYVIAMHIKVIAPKNHLICNP